MEGLRIFLLCFSQSSSIIYGATVILRDGTILKGDITSVFQDSILIKTSIGTINVKRADITNIDLDEQKEQKEVSVSLKDGTVINGYIISRTDSAISLKTTVGNIMIETEKIEAIKESQVLAYFDNTYG